MLNYDYIITDFLYRTCMSIQKTSIKNTRTFRFYVKESKIFTISSGKNIMFCFARKYRHSLAHCIIFICTFDILLFINIYVIVQFKI